MADNNDLNGSAAGLAALSICESLLLALGDLEIMDEKEAVGIIEDAAAAHRGAGSSSKDVSLHREVIAILERIIASGNSVRHP